ncbi:helix-turn-helix transcriptional regulator [Paenibacillus arenilitoris]|uniref:Helix-turn-helix transcriptional regulator n=1 Tax=Paenibacillus arenilitoris TaxID=2772299 RepID=A0A927CJ31_9BACL|nr:AraC family transcriptional regulator [Paenibacillus arenilitoris]MBD2867637.1 helix-turn-helix transcriptional regulator [Paenibacillus arenilitoris]
MEEKEHIYFAAPPLPYYLESGETFHAPGDQHPSRKQLGIFDLILMESGELFIGEEERQWTLTAGQTLLLLPDRYHYSVRPSEQPAHFYWVHFQSVGEWQQTGQEQASLDYEAHQKRFLTSPYSLHLPKKWTLPYPEQAFRLMRTLNKAGGERQSSAFWTQQQTFEELLRLMDLRQTDDGISPVVTLAEKAEAYIKNNYRAGVTSKTLAEALNFHYNYITRCMKQVYGMTPAEYLTKCRLEQAKLLLLKTEWPVAEIAMQVGFENVPYFSNCFARQIGLPPSKFRKRYST